MELLAKKLLFILIFSIALYQLYKWYKYFNLALKTRRWFKTQAVITVCDIKLVRLNGVKLGLDFEYEYNVDNINYKNNIINWVFPRLSGFLLHNLLKISEEQISEACTHFRGPISDDLGALLHGCWSPHGEQAQRGKQEHHASNLRIAEAEGGESCRS